MRTFGWGEWGSQGYSIRQACHLEGAFEPVCSSRLAALQRENACLIEICFFPYFLLFFFTTAPFPFLLSIPFATLHEKQNITLLLTCKLFFVCLRFQRVLFGQKCQRAEINCLYRLFLFAAVGVWPYNGTTNRH